MGFYNSEGRLFIDKLLHYYFRDKTLDIVNMGDGGRNSMYLNPLQYVFEYIPNNLDVSSSSSEKDSPQKESAQKEKDSSRQDSSQQDSSCSSSQESQPVDAFVHTPV